MIPVVAEEALSRTIEIYLAGSRNALVLEDGTTLFDLTRSKYSLSGEYGKCLLHLWSEERNTVRRVLDAQEKKERFSSRCSAWASRARPASRSAAVMTRERRTLAKPPAPLTSASSSACSRELFRSFVWRT